MEPIKMTHMPALICGRGAVKFAATLGRKRAAVIGYTDSVEEKARGSLPARIRKYGISHLSSGNPSSETSSTTCRPYRNSSRISSWPSAGAA